MEGSDQREDADVEHRHRHQELDQSEARLTPQSSTHHLMYRQQAPVIECLHSYGVSAVVEVGVVVVAVGAAEATGSSAISRRT